MAKKNQCKYPVGTTEKNGYVVTIERYTSAYQNADNSRICAKFWGRITSESGDVTESPETGWTVGDIDKIVGNTEKRVYNRGGVQGESQAIKKLRAAIATNLEYGLPTEQLESMLKEKIAEMEANREEKKRVSAEERKRINAIKAQIKKLEKSVELHKELGIDYVGLELKIQELQERIS